MAYFLRPQSSNSAVRIVNPAEQVDDAKPLPKRGVYNLRFPFKFIQTLIQQIRLYANVGIF
jgi:hypothetical protein